MAVWFGKTSTRRLAIAAMLLLFAAGSWHAHSAVAKASNGQTARAFAASTSRPYCLKGQHLKGNKKRGYKCWFRKHGEWTWEGVECQAHYQRHSIYRHGHETGERCVPAPHTSTSAPLNVYGSISSVRAVTTTGNTLAATFAISTSGCTGESCSTYAHAFFVYLPQDCTYGDGVHKWIFKGSARPVPDRETGAATFGRSPGPIRICLYVHVHTKSSEPETLAAETIVDAAGSNRPRVPLTVTNICSFNPGLGVRYPYRGPKGPGIYWDSNRDGVGDFGAQNVEGDSAVDVAWVNDSHGVLTWIAHCYPGETAWINLPRYLREHGQPQPQPQQPSAPAGPTGNINDLLNILGQTTSGNPWLSSSPAVGTVEQNYGQCGYSPSIYATCVTYPPTDPTVL